MTNNGIAWLITGILCAVPVGCALAVWVIRIALEPLAADVRRLADQLAPAVEETPSDLSPSGAPAV
jgi:hypothetical protein